MEHPAFKVPDDPHGKARYMSAKKHAEAAKDAGKSSEEIHAIFKKVMEFDPMDIESIPKDETHAKYRNAMIHVKAAKEKGMSANEIHAMYDRIMTGKAGKHKRA